MFGLHRRFRGALVGHLAIFEMTSIGPMGRYATGLRRSPHAAAGTAADRLTEIAPLLGDDVEYMGEVDQAEKVALLGGACATLFPIRWNEPFGLVMIESMACGTPVLAFHEGAAPEVVADGETGYLCRDEAEMVEKVKHIGDIDRAACRAAVEGYFSRRRMIGEHVEFYEEILAKHKG